MTGIPEGLSPAPPIDYAAILEHEQMQERPDPESPSRLARSCVTPTADGGAPIVAYPPRRLVRAGQLLEEAGARVVLQSLCRDDLTEAFDAILRELAMVLADDCLPRLSRNAAGRLPCALTEVMTPGRRCEEVPGRELVNRTFVAGEEVEVCRVAQLAVHDGVVAPGEGWFFGHDDSAEASGRCPPGRTHRITSRGPPLAEDYEIACWWSASGSADDPLGVGSSCATGCGQRVEGHQNPLACEPASRTCQPPCERASECLGGYTCFAGFCVNPTC